MARITRDHARSYLARWKRLDEAQIRELRATSIETRLRQLSALMASREFFIPDPERQRGVEDVRQRWARIRLAFDD